MKKGFVAAPLIGTTIFLASIIFIANLQSIESSASLRIAGDAYSNRVTSVLEEYRSDLSSIFREGLSRTISFYLLRPGWSEFTWSNDPGQSFYAAESDPDTGVTITNRKVDGSVTGNPDGKIQLQELKKAKCESVKRITSDIICSLSSGATSNNNYAYGLPQWMQHFSKDFTFEGISFTTSNKDQVKVFQPDLSDNAQITRYVNKCTALLKGSIFDCDNYANAPQTSPDPVKFKCKDPVTGLEVPGCEDGIFFVQVDIENNEVYPFLPRVEASDGGQNLVRSAGISDKNFYLPINLRLFKYYDETFKIYSRLAYGDSESNQNQADSEGVEQGHCGGLTGPSCQSAPGFQDLGYPAGLNADQLETQDAIVQKVKETFFDKVVGRACKTSKDVWAGSQQTAGLNLQVRDGSSGSSGATSVDCTDAAGVLNPEVLPLSQDPTAENCVPSDTAATTQYCAYYGGTSFGSSSANILSAYFRLVDGTPSFRIDPQQPVSFDWSVSLQHYS